MKPANRIVRLLMSLVSVTILLLPGTGFAQGVSFSTNGYNVGGLCVSVATADFNGDGKLDLIAASIRPVGGPQTVIALTNNGAGIFQSNSTLYVDYDLVCVVPAGVNNNGKPDLIFASDYANTLIVVTNNGNGIYGSNATYSVGSYPLIVLAADINGDGKPDLICANEAGRSLTILTNNGGGIFTSNATYAVGNYPISLVAADVNGDGQPDLICANANDNTLTVLTNNGSGVFGSNATLNAGSRPAWLVAADVNGDGYVDLICANAGTYQNYGDTLTIFTNNGHGVFGSNATLIVGSDPLCVVVADVNGDGTPDLITANAAGNSLTVLTNNGSGLFGFNATITVTNEPTRLVAADVSGDGKVDLICAGSPVSGSNALTVLINTTPFPPPSLSIFQGNGQVALTWPAWATNYVLESATDLSAPDWATVTNGAPISGGMTVTDMPPASYFRLHRF